MKTLRFIRLFLTLWRCKWEPECNPLPAATAAYVAWGVWFGPAPKWLKDWDARFTPPYTQTDVSQEPPF